MLNKEERKNAERKKNKLSTEKKYPNKKCGCIHHK
jgi:hypothetical protein